MCVVEEYVMGRGMNREGIKCSLCSIPIDEIGYWAEKRFIEGISTVELLHQAESDREREIITVVGMLDVDDDKLDGMLKAAKECDCNIFACRSKLKDWLRNRLELALLLTSFWSIEVACFIL